MATEASSAFAKLAESTKTACATSADIVKSAAKPGTRAAVTGSKAAVFTHSVFFAALGGIIVGALACYFADKYWLSKKGTSTES
jgi:hypothetical protein